MATLLLEHMPEPKRAHVPVKEQQVMQVKHMATMTANAHRAFQTRAHCWQTVAVERFAALAVQNARKLKHPDTHFSRHCCPGEAPLARLST